MSFLVQCYQCGGSVSTEMVQRREMQTRSLFGWSEGTGLGMARSTERVNLCPACATTHDQRTYYRFVVGTFWILSLTACLILCLLAMSR